jgi:hypothetical protein
MFFHWICSIIYSKIACILLYLINYIISKIIIDYEQDHINRQWI